jgi:tRNA threonylcarbamoyladenosine biosynthesis protein TsaE
MLNIQISKIEDLKGLSIQLLKLLEAENINLITMIGDLGAGKTTFTQYIGKELGIEKPIQSPTFILMNEYELPKSKTFKKLYHIDAYRLDREEETDILDIEDILRDKTNLMIVEWADNIPKSLNGRRIEIKISKEGEIRNFDLDIKEK